jgi:hypothetical protein
MPHPTTPAVVRHPDTGILVALNPAEDYDPADVLVKAYGWAFTPREHSDKIVESVEVATAVPGQKRTRSNR